MRKEKRSEKKRFGKKAITVAFLITTILIILGLVILIFFISQLSWTGNVDREICHQSVIYRATLPNFAGAKDYVPLKCKAEKFCITSGIVGGKCNEFKGVEGVTKVKVKNEEDIERFIAKDIVDCWETMGEGKLALFNDWWVSNFGFGTVASSCVICSRIAFDNENLEKAKINLDKIDVKDYMITHKIPNKDVSYYVYLTGNRGKMSIKEKITGSVEIETISEEEVDAEGVSFEEPKESVSNELGVMFMQVRSPGHWDVLKNDLSVLGLGGVGSFVLAPKYTSKAMVSAAKSPWFWTVLAIAGIVQQGSVAANRAVTAGYCGDVSIGSEAKQGCSVVRTVGYDVEDISKYCSVIESIP